MHKKNSITGALFSLLCLSSTAAMAACPVGHTDLTNALTAAVGDNGGLNFNMWATVVKTDGTVCAVSKTGDPGSITDIWLGSRVISAQKANTANAFSTDDLALSTANLYSPVQPGGSLYGLQHSNPVDTRVAYSGNSHRFGKSSDPMRNRRIGGINVFGGGLALYDAGGNKVGAIGVSGDSACADHNIAWRVRAALSLDNIPGGVSDAGTDNIIFLAEDEAPNGFEHPQCLNGPPDGEVCKNEAITGEPNTAGVACP